MLKNKKQPIPTRRQAAREADSAKIFSYYNNRSSSSQNTGRSQKESKNRRIQWQLVPSFIAVAAIFVSLVYASTLSNKPLVRKAKSSSVALLQSDAVYQDAAQNLLSKSLFNRSKLLIDTRHIEGQMLAAYPELRSVSITVPLTARQPIVTLQAAQPKLLLRTTSGLFVIDDSGKALRKLSDEAQAKQLSIPVVQDETGLQVDVGKIALAPRDVTFIDELSHQLSAKQVQAETLTLPALANELRIKPVGQGYYIKFNLLADPRLQAGTYLAMAQKLANDGARPSEYIDVRVEEKVFYK